MTEGPSPLEADESSITAGRVSNDSSSAVFEMILLPTTTVSPRSPLSAMAEVADLKSSVVPVTVARDGIMMSSLSPRDTVALLRFLSSAAATKAFFADGRGYARYSKNIRPNARTRPPLNCETLP